MPEKENSDVVVKEPRSVVRKFLARPQGEGMGAIVRRSIGRWEKKKKKKKRTHLLLFLVSMKWMRIWDVLSKWVNLCVVSGLSWDTLILSLFWMNSQVGYSVLFPLFSHGIMYVEASFLKVFFSCFWRFGCCMLQLLLLLDFLIIHIEVWFSWESWCFCLHMAITMNLIECFLFNRIWDSHIHVAGTTN